MLMVEDSEDEAFLLYSELNARGVRLDWTRVDNGPDLRRALVERDWDIIICDHNMPGFDSSAALEIAKASGKDIPFIIYSGQISDQQAVSAMHEGVQDYIDKGNYARLMPVIERELKNAAARSAVRQADNRIQELAYYDDLSNLPNHNLFCARVTEWILDAEKRADGAGGAVFYIDLDRFLRLNTSFGYDTGNAILRAVAQRLARMVCASCATKYYPSEQELHDAGISEQEGRPFRRGAGCLQCHDSGFQGRIGIYEVMEVTPNLRRLIHHGAPTHELRECIQRNKGLSLRDEGVLLAIDGRTSLDEILRVTQNDDDTSAAPAESVIPTPAPAPPARKEAA